jgi:glycosyltransferase involved in cell wall biosynthesis
MVSVLIPVRNEAANIVACIASVRWANEIVVVDSGSTDGTVETAKSKGASVVQFQWNGKFPKKKNWALENVPWKNEWVLILDADERITPELAAEIQAELKQPRTDGYFINRRFIFLGKWIRHCGYYPSWNLRLFRHAKGRYEMVQTIDTASGDNEVHEHVVLQGASAHLKNDMLHYAYPDIYTWMEKHNRYSNWEAEIEVRGQGAGSNAQNIGGQLAKRRALRVLSRRLPFRPTLRFIYSYILKRGFLDGREGYMFCRLLATYEMLNVFKACELRRKAKDGSQ